MSHDVVAFSKSTGEKISEITISPADQGKSWIFYESLNCTEHNLGFCGKGERIIEEDILSISMSKFLYLKGESPSDVEKYISKYAPFKKYCCYTKKILSIAGMPPDQIITRTDIKKIKDIENFIRSIQGKGSVVIVFG